MSHSRTTTLRGRLRGRRQTHSTRSPPADRFRRNISRGASSGPTAAELPASRAAHRQQGPHQVDGTFRLAQLGGGHPLECLVPQRFGCAPGVGRDGERRWAVGRLSVRLRLAIRPSARTRTRPPEWPSGPSSGGVGGGGTGDCARRSRRRQKRAKARSYGSISSRRRTKSAGTCGADLFAIADVDQLERPRVVEHGCQVGGHALASELAPEVEDVAQKDTSRDGLIEHVSRRLRSPRRRGVRRTVL